VLLNSGAELVSAAGETNYLFNLLASFPGAADGIDVVGMQDGWSQTTPVLPDSAWQLQYLEAIDLQAYLAESPLAGKRFWLTRADFRRTFNGLSTQRDLSLAMARAMPFALAAGAAHISYSTLQAPAGADASTQWAALLDAAGHRREAFYTLQSLISRLEGFQRGAVRDLGNAGVAACFVTAGNQPLTVVWNASNLVRTVSIPVGPVSWARLTPALPASYSDSTANWSPATNPVVNGVVTVAVSGMPVYVEATVGVDPDIDGDGMPNDIDPDMDGDGMPNDYETAHGLNPFVPDANADADRDGFSNVAEYRAGTDPQQDLESLRFIDSDRVGAALRFEWAAVSGMTYQVQWCTNFRAWSDAGGGLIRASGSTGTWMDCGSPPSSTNNTGRFYRLRLQP
jgi:hypothetical protein